MNLDFRPSSASFLLCDFTNPYHCKRLCEMVNSYISDPMGGGQIVSERQKLYLLDGLESNPNCIVMLAVENVKIIGYVIAFINFSTFLVKPMMNIHDVYIEPEYRNNGWGRRMISQLIEIAERNKFGKLTLEVRKDNPTAQHTYTKLGFQEGDTPMYFYTRMIE